MLQDKSFHQTTPIPLEVVEQSVQNLVIDSLAKEFGQENNYDSTRQYFEKSLSSPNTYTMINMVNGQLVGACTFNVFDWSKIKPQLYYLPNYTEEQLSSLQFTRFEDAVKRQFELVDTTIAVEMAYNYVHPSHRGQGLGREQWKQRIDYIKSAYTAPIIFTLARSEYIGTGIQQSSTEVMLAAERRVQGVEKSMPVQVQGVEVSIQEINDLLQTDLSHINYYSGSKASIKFAHTEGFLPVAFSRNFCPVWAKQLTNSLPTEES